ncbi:ABC transporter substrate-binding protein [Skermania piniformis]
MPRFASRLLVAFLALCALVAGCASTDLAGDSTAGGSPTDGSAASVAVPAVSTAAESGGVLTVQHQYGATVIPSRPTRVITLLGSWTDTLIALDVPITAEYVQQGFGGKYNRFAWTPEHVSEVHAVPSLQQVNVEELAAYQPDLILAGYVGDRAIYDKLSKLAPTIPVIATDSVMDTWQQITTTAGEIFGRQDQARSLIDEVDAKIDRFTRDHPAIEGKTADFTQLGLDNQIYAVVSATDPATRLLSEVGLGMSPQLRAIPANGMGRVMISNERVGDLAADLLLAWPLVGGPPAYDKVPGWAALPAVQSGAVLYLDNDNAAAFSYPSVYSVPFALDLLAPAAAKVR